MPTQTFNTVAMVTIAMVTILCLGLGFLIGWLVAHDNQERLQWKEDLSVIQQLQEAISADRIRQNLRSESPTLVLCQ